MLPCCFCKSNRTRQERSSGNCQERYEDAIKLAYEFISMLPDKECPECTEGYEGFYHVTDIKGTVEEATVDFIIRDHDRAIFEKRKEVIAQAAEKLKKYMVRQFLK